MYQLFQAHKSFYPSTQKTWGLNGGVSLFQPCSLGILKYPFQSLERLAGLKRLASRTDREILVGFRQTQFGNEPLEQFRVVVLPRGNENAFHAAALKLFQHGRHFNEFRPRRHDA